MVHPIRRVLVLPLLLGIGGSATAAAQGPVYSPELPLWGIYATGNGYIVNSPAMVERANYEGISIECFKTMNIAVMPGSLIPPDTPANYWLSRSMAAGLIETKATGLTWWEAQTALNIYSPYRNPLIQCLGPYWASGEPTGNPPLRRALPGDGYDQRMMIGASFTRQQHKFYAVQRVFEDLTWTVRSVRGMPEGFIGRHEQELQIQGWVSPGYNPALNSAEGVDASLRCIGKCQFIDPETRRSLGGWLRWKIDRRNPSFNQTILIRSNAGPQESFEIELAAGGLKTVWPYRPRQ